MSIPIPKAPDGQRLGRHIYSKRRFCTLWFWRYKNLANSTTSQEQSNKERLMRCIIYSPHWLRTILSFVVWVHSIYFTGVGLSALYQRCTLKDDISYLLPTWLSAGTGKLKRKHHFIGWQERTNKMKNKSCATNFATQQPFSLLLLLQEPFLLAERKKMCYLSMAANQSQYTNINSFILGYIY